MLKNNINALIGLGLLLNTPPVLAATNYNYDRTLTINGTGYDMGHAVAYDKAGNLYYAGHISSGTDVDPTAGVDVRSTTNDSVDILLTKINADGSYAWSRTLGGNYFDRGSSLVTDNAGNVYLAGNFSGAVDFNPGGTADVHTSANNGFEYDNFVTRINADGSYGWTRVLGGYFYIYGRTIDVDSKGNVYVAGAFSIPQDFALEGTGDIRTPVGGDDIFLSKLNADGSYAWTYTMGSTGYDMGHAVAVDDSDNVYFSGHFVGTVDLDPTDNVANFTSQNNSADVFIIKFDANSTYQWTKTFGGAGWDGPYNLETDAAGNLYTSGLFAGTSDLDPTDGIENHTSIGPVDIYVTKLNADGTFGWARTLGEPANFYYNEVNWGGSMTVDRGGNIFLARCFVDSMDFNPGIGTDLRTSAGLTDIFVSQINSDGSYGWTHTMGGTSSDCANAIAVSEGGQLAVAGNFQGTADFNPAVGDSVTSASGLDIFVTTFNRVSEIVFDVTRIKVDVSDKEISFRSLLTTPLNLNSADLVEGTINGVNIASAHFSEFLEIDPGILSFRSSNTRITIDLNRNTITFKNRQIDLAQVNLGIGAEVSIKLGDKTGSSVFTGTVIYD